MAALLEFQELSMPHCSLANHLIFHPDGKKIVQTVEDLFGNLGKNNNELLRQYGNISSESARYAMFYMNLCKKQSKSGEQSFILSFDPGFSA